MELPEGMSAERLVRCCQALANGHWRRGITPDNAARDYDALIEALATSGASPNPVPSPEPPAIRMRYLKEWDITSGK